MSREKSGCGLTSWPRETSSILFLDELLLLFRYIACSGAALLAGSGIAVLGVILPSQGHVMALVLPSSGNEGIPGWRIWALLMWLSLKELEVIGLEELEAAGGESDKPKNNTPFDFQETGFVTSKSKDLD